MNNKKKSTRSILPYLLSTLLFSCGDRKNSNPMGTGIFESEETTISAGGTGEIVKLKVEEGDNIDANSVLGQIDTTDLYYLKEQLVSELHSLQTKKINIKPQISNISAEILAKKKYTDVLESRHNSIQFEKKRYTALVNADAIPSKSLDDIVAENSLVEKQIDQSKEEVNVLQTKLKSESIKNQSENLAITSDSGMLIAKIEQLNYQIKKCQIINPIKGTVTKRFSRAFEHIKTGSPIYTIADNSKMYLRVYFPYREYTNCHIGQQVAIKIDDGIGGQISHRGQIISINTRAEFQPKGLQSPDERTNLVYSARILVLNPELKIKSGMYGEAFAITQK
ncbi:HlyD family efflux transporter periplasmic adaptor subunit [Chitinophaga varians]|uniref:HlyD family efflux transporter periplasmic adaptor subunit n=1 Tax=Chitinophaga varians TaxID=2202339 RepID=A0A847S0L5_9BACT|nr:HlyD family efflux transporter periplasmic adaptor subunit [Chitinophaga varians]NLR67874.1 HlyD family efflux transporter periplasmic adaptor subunit [Chitinophaga varians]